MAYMATSLLLRLASDPNHALEIKASNHLVKFIVGDFSHS